MYLKKIIVINYKSCRDLILNLDSDLPNTFIGKTDAGKTSILKATGLLLEEKSYPVLLKEGQDACDISTTTIDPEKYKGIFKQLNLPIFDTDIASTIIVIGVLNKEDADLDSEFDDLSSSHLKWAIESGDPDNIYLLREFNRDYQLGRYFLLSKDGDNKNKELWKETQNTLNGFIKELNISEADITNDNKKGRFKNIEKFRAIYNRTRTSSQWTPYEDFKKDKIFFPFYRYIDWREINLKGIEALAQDTMSETIEDYSLKLRDQAEKLSREATEKVNAQINEKIKEIIVGLPSIKTIRAKVYFESSGVISEIVVIKDTSDGEVRLESQGDGVKKQIGFAFMKLAALKTINPKKKHKKFIWAFDEPEIHLYPAEKREFYDIIRELSKGGFQTIISTHSTVFVDKSKINTIRQVSLENKYTTVSMCTSVSDVHQSLRIKNSDFLFYDIFIGGEGDSEEVLIPHFYSLYFGKDIRDASIQVINLGGYTLWKKNRKILEQVLKDFKNPKDCLFSVLDADTNAAGENIFLIGKFDIEDSIDDKHWEQLVKDKCGVVLNKNDFGDIRASLNPNNKFLKLLRDKITTIPTRAGYLPSKKDCAIYMKDYITKKEDMPKDFSGLFTALDSRIKSLS